MYDQQHGLAYRADPVPTLLAVDDAQEAGRIQARLRLGAVTVGGSKLGRVVNETCAVAGYSPIEGRGSLDFQL
jgi:hypothetical protein